VNSTVHGRPPIGDGGADRVELLHHGEAGLVGDHVLAGLDRCEGDAGAPVGHRCGDHEIDGLVGEDLVVTPLDRLGPPPGVRLHQSAVGAVGHGLGPGLHQPVDDLEQMHVVGPDHRDPPPHCATPVTPGVRPPA
jgi:hypothetical protein